MIKINNLSFDKRYIKGLLGFCLLIGFSLKLKFIFQSSLWPDEALYLYIARNLSADLTNLTDISGNLFYQNPPLLLYVLSLFSDIKSIEFEQAARGVVMLMASALVVITYFIGKKVYHPIVGVIASGLLAVCPLTNWTGVRILTDIPAVFFIYLSICMLVYGKQAAFYFFGLCAFLTKFSAFPVLFLSIFFKMKKEKWRFVYAGIFIGLYIIIISKSFSPEPVGWLAYFYGFFELPDLHQMAKETEYFIGYFLAGFFLLGLSFTVKECKYSVLFHWLFIFAIFRFFLPWIVFRVSRYTLPLYPGIYIFTAYGIFQCATFIIIKYPNYSKWVRLCFGIAVSIVLFAHSMKSMELLNQTSKTFIGFEEASLFLKKQSTPHSVATASPMQMKYFAREFDTYDIDQNLSPIDLRKFIKEKNIQYLSIDLWSPHLPPWFRNFDFEKNGYKLLYNNQKVYIFKVIGSN